MTTFSTNSKLKMPKKNLKTSLKEYEGRNFLELALRSPARKRSNRNTNTTTTTTTESGESTSSNLELVSQSLTERINDISLLPSNDRILGLTGIIRARLTSEHLSTNVSHSQIDRLNSCIQEVQQVAGAIRTPNRKRSVQRSLLSVVERLRGPEMHEAKRKADSEVRRERRMSQENEESRRALNETRRNSYTSQENEANRKARNENRRNDYQSRVQQYANQIEREKEILHNCLAQAASGQVPDIPLEMCGSVNRGASAFINQQFTNILYECDLCKEKWWPNSNLPTMPYTCSQCKKDMKTVKIPRFSHLNDMNPLYPHNADPTRLQEFENEYYSLLQECPLSAIEEALIARRTVVMQAYRLKGGQQGFSGNVISFPQRTSDLAQYLPRMASSIKWITVRCKRAADPSEYKDFKVHRSYIRRWLLFLVKW